MKATTHCRFASLTRAAPAPGRLLRLLAAALFLAGLARAESTLAVMEQVADWQLAHPADCSATDWQNGAFYSGVMALAEVSPSARFTAAMRRMGEANRWQPGERPYHADDQAVGQTYIDLSRICHDPGMIRPLRERFDYILAHPQDDNLLFDPVRNPGYLDRWSWCDSLFMAPPTWAKLARLTGDPRYLEYAVKKWWVTSDYLYDRTEHLYFRDSTYFGRREKNGRQIHWARGNGWVFAGLVHLLQNLPQDHPARLRFVQQFREMAGRIADLQSADGFWRASLLDPENYPMQESSGTGFFCYGIAWGVNEDLLDKARYAPVATKAWAALLGCVQPDGKLTQVQPVGATPGHFDAGHTGPYGVGAFLLAGREMLRLEGSDSGR
ncbi:MAG: glycoside hydrolase family 105 protein [Opitutales bacterium]